MMKKILISFILLLLTLFLSISYPRNNYQNKTGKLIIIVIGFSNDNGNVKIALFNSKENYEGKGDVFKGMIVSIKNKTARCEISGIPYGEYAVRLFHDENSNDILDTNFIGLPGEDYGFSNNPGTLFGYPKYDRVKFIIEENVKEVTIEVD